MAREAGAKLALGGRGVAYEECEVQHEATPRGIINRIQKPKKKKRRKKRGERKGRERVRRRFLCGLAIFVGLLHHLLRLATRM
jgi:hypothetical protein